MFFRSFFFLFAFLLAALYPSGKPRLGILKLNAGKGTEKSVNVIQDKLYSGLNKLSYLVIVDRTRVDQLLEEQALSASGMVDEKASLKIGKLLSANKMLFGDVVKAGKQIKFTFQIIDVETSEIDFSGGNSVEADYEWEEKIGRILDDLDKAFKKKLMPSPMIEKKKVIISGIKKAGVLALDSSSGSLLVSSKKKVYIVKGDKLIAHNADLPTLRTFKDDVVNPTWVKDVKIVGMPGQYFLTQKGDRQPLPDRFVHDLKAATYVLKNPAWLNADTIIFHGTAGESRQLIYYFPTLGLFLESGIKCLDFVVNDQNSLNSLSDGQIMAYTIAF